MVSKKMSWVVVVMKWKRQGKTRDLWVGEMGMVSEELSDTLLFPEIQEIINRAWIKPKRNLSSGLIKSSLYSGKESSCSVYNHIRRLLLPQPVYP